MTDHDTSGENVSFLGGADPDVLVLEERLERLLAAPLDTDAAWALVRDRIVDEPSVVPLRTRHRRLRPLVLAIAAALLVSGAALAAVAQRGGPAERHIGPSGSERGTAPAATARRGDGSHDPSLQQSADANMSVGPSAPVGTPSAGADTGASSPSAETSSGSDQQSGQDQQGSQDQGQQSPDPSSGDTSDGGDGQSDASPASSGGDQGSLLPSSSDGDQ